MPHTNRFLRQIETVNDVFQMIQNHFQNHEPVDQTLTRYFRQSKQHGSKDRRLISGCIFGYYRWYGWLRQLETKEIKTALLLGYLLDQNEETDLIRFWKDQTKIDRDQLDPLNRPETDLAKKANLLKNAIPDSSLSALTPDFLPEQSEERLNALQSRASLWIRLRSHRKQSFLMELKTKGIDYTPHPGSDCAFKINGRVNLNEFKSFREGELEVQDLSSQGIGLICQPKEGETWWDVCAGSGGKALHLAAMMNNRGKVLATEIREKTLKELQKRQKRGKLHSIYPILWDGKKIPDFDDMVDHILVDAPCSCSGTWRRSPDLRWTLTEEKVVAFSKLQLSILKKAAPILPPGGTLTYATCSIMQQENEEVVAKFLEKHTDFSLLLITNPFTGEESKGGILFQPPEVDGNGMFVAKMIRS